MTKLSAPAKLNLALVVGPTRPDGRHEVATVLQAVDLCDEIELVPAEALTVEGFSEDTIVRETLARLAQAAHVSSSWRVRIEKRIPVAAGLGGGSSDAAAALTLANPALPTPLSEDELQALAAGIGADVPFFLRAGTQLGTSDGSDLSPLDLPTDYVALLLSPHGVRKESTADVYRQFDERRGAEGFEQRRSRLLGALDQVADATDLASLPGNDLVSSPLARDLEALGAFRAGVTGAGPVVYGLFARTEIAEHAASALRDVARMWLARPLGRRV